MNKLDVLKERLCSLRPIAVAFSGGVDSTFLLKFAHDLLGDDVLAIIGKAPLFPSKETAEAINFCEDEGIRYKVFNYEPLELDTFKKNPPDRCYWCKRKMFKTMRELAVNYTLVDGSNYDDLSDYRPGFKAVKELNVVSPLQEAKLTKQEIRDYSKSLGLSTWNKPSFACLASRFVYGDQITSKGLVQIERAEDYLSSLGFIQYRVRVHNKLARIEVIPEEFTILLKYHKEIDDTFKALGFDYVTMDLKGYRTGSMNEVLKEI